MDPHEEQQQELEVLESIYPDELTIISESKFQIHINLDTNSERKHALVLEVKFPETYPEVVPELDIEVGNSTAEDEDDDGYSEDGDDDDGDDKLVIISETIEFEKADLNLLKSKLNEEAELQVGIPMIFALATTLKDEAEQLFQDKVDTAQKAYDDEMLEREREEQKKFNGTKVTPESFAEWRTNFRAEMKLEEKDKQRFNDMHQGKLTGREIFEKGLAGGEDDDDNVNEITENVQNVTVH
ncbi:uncharacterized protein KQ657_001465 [Scheffersomyces spartinae]|uniref:RWD domain-containing protein n=1 Tax=Scheffersomyces spartinae TaxID=45513 RepID=A0A9P7V798_9ASCO|nr:uncharacterized protein KQ657_001465 [Scheffersomyces spartinae]KAG7192684.1 hypothetical protein KQ657_001465 [Scheffersomyces spartinae]